MVAEQLYVIHWQIMKNISSYTAREPVLRLWKKNLLDFIAFLLQFKLLWSRGNYEYTAGKY